MLSRGEEPSTTGRELLALFGAKRRGWRVVASIRDELFARKLMTEPDFDEVWVDVPLRLKRPQAAPTSTTTPSTEAPSVNGSSADGKGETKADASAPPLSPLRKVTDPIRRISLLRSANKPVVSVPPSTSLKEAMTTMMLEGFSQLPVMQSQASRECKGAVTWQSIATATALGKECRTVNDCMISVEVVEWE